jgi:hypothetical protein
MISGPFDAQKLLTKLSHRAGKVIKDIKEKEKPKESKPAEAIPAEKKKPEKEDKPAEQPKKEEKQPEKEKKPAEKKPEKDETPAKIVPGPPEPVPVPVLQPTCCPTPYYERYYGGCRCCVCGQIFGYDVVPPWGPNYAPPYDGYSVYHFSSEEDPSASTCTIM